MLGGDTKKDVQTGAEIHYNKRAMSLRLVERGLARVAGQSCLAGPSVAPAAPNFGHCRTGKYGTNPRPVSQAFSCRVGQFFARESSTAQAESPLSAHLTAVAASAQPQHLAIMHRRDPRAQREKRWWGVYPRFHFRISRSMAVASIPAINVGPIVR